MTTEATPGALGSNAGLGGCNPERDPCCDRCGAPITTGLMAAFCPHRERCEYWPEDEESQKFIDDLGLRLKQ